MHGHPYKYEIIGIYSLGALLLIVETWRRWGNLISYSYLDDVWLVSLAFVAAYFLYKKTYFGQLLWLFTCGCAFCMITGSFFYAWSQLNEIDASGYSTSSVLIVKGGIYVLVSLMSVRSFRLLLRHRFD